MAGEVIVGYDGSACAKGALSQAVEQARAFGAGLVIAFAYEPPAAGAEMADHRHALEERGKALTEEAVGLVAGSGVEANAVVVDARPAHGLLALAAEHQARMIVVGTHGEPPIRASCSARPPTSSCTAPRCRSWWCGSPTPERRDTPHAGRYPATRASIGLTTTVAGGGGT
jgi:nucleotide-binding universal stress UspA family protein